MDERDGQRGNHSAAGTWGRCVAAVTGKRGWIAAVGAVRYTKLKPRWDVHLSGDDDQLG